MGVVGMPDVGYKEFWVESEEKRTITQHNDGQLAAVQ